jgi:hypothetical protein
MVLAGASRRPATPGKPLQTSICPHALRFQGLSLRSTRSVVVCLPVRSRSERIFERPSAPRSAAQRATSAIGERRSARDSRAIDVGAMDATTEPTRDALSQRVGALVDVFETIIYAIAFLLLVLVAVGGGPAGALRQGARPAASRTGCAGPVGDRDSRGDLHDSVQRTPRVAA